jgi:hypothetical protein
MIIYDNNNSYYYIVVLQYIIVPSPLFELPIQFLGPISPLQGLYLHAVQHEHKQSMPEVGFETMASVFPGSKIIYALHFADTVTGV